MIIPAKYDGRCAKCGRGIKKGSEIEYVNKKAFHVECAPELQREIGTTNDGALADALHYRHYSREELQGEE